MICRRPRSIDWAGTVLIALVLAPLDPGPQQGQRLGLGLGSDARLLRDHGRWRPWCSSASSGAASAPLVDLELLRNRVLVGATLAILIVAGTINALMYVLSLYFQNPAAFGMSALEAGLATLPAAAGMIAITPLIAPLAGRIGGGAAVALGFGLAAAGFAVLAFVESSWTYAAFVRPAGRARDRPRRRERPGVVGIDGGRVPG